MSNISPSKMKAILMLFAFFLITASSADDTSEAVLDVSGEPVLAGVDYYILPILNRPGGGLTLASSTNKSSCPLDVVQESLKRNKGLPVRFSPFNGDKVVRISTDQNFIFSASTICVQSTVWTLKNVEAEYIVSIGGVAGNPGRETLSNWFRIDKEGDSYKIVFCPGVCDICRPFCGSVGVVVRNGIRRLVLTQVPLKLVFWKV